MNEQINKPPSVDKDSILKLKAGVRQGRALKDLFLAQPGIVSVAAGAKLLDQVISRTDDGKRRFFDVRDFPWVKDIEASFELIRSELDKMLSRGAQIPKFRYAHEAITGVEHWHALIFFAYGNEIEPELQGVPRDSADLAQRPGATARHVLGAPSQDAHTNAQRRV